MIYLGDMRELSKDLEDNSIDLIFTDPPYHDEFLCLYRDLGRIAQRVLKPGGFIAAYTGNRFIPVIQRWWYRAGLKYFWTFAGIQLDSTQRYFEKKIFVDWRPVIVYSKGKPELHGWCPDGVKTNRDKKWHPWGQGEKPIERWISALTDKGDLVLDPFVGGASTIVACILTGRKYIGFEIEEEWYSKALQRIREMQRPLFISEPKQGVFE